MLQGVRNVHLTYCSGGEQCVRRKVHAVGLEPHFVVAQSYTRSTGASKPTRLALHIKLATAAPQFEPFIRCAQVTPAVKRKFIHFLAPMQAVGVQGIVGIVHAHRTSEHEQSLLGSVLTTLKLDRSTSILQSSSRGQQGHFPLQVVPQNGTRQLPGLSIQLHAAVRIGFCTHPLSFRVQLHLIGLQRLRAIR